MFSARKRPLFRTVGGRVIQGTFLRSGPAWLDGVEYATNVPRFPSVNGVVGLLNEEATVNLQGAYRDVTAWDKGGNIQSVSTQPGTFRGQPTYLVTTKNTATSSQTLVRKFAQMMGYTPTAGESYTVTFYARKVDYRYFGVRCLGTGAHNTLDFDTGAVYNNGGADSIKARQVEDGWWEITATKAVTVTGDALIGICLPGTTAGGETWTTTGQRVEIANFMQVERKAYPTSVMLSPYTRGAETTTVATNGLLTPQAGSVKTRAYVGSRQKGPTNVAGFCLFSAGTYGAANTIFMGHSGTAFYARIFGASATVNQANWTGGALTEGFHDFQIEWDASQVRLYIDGILRASAAITNPMTAIPATAYIGSMAASSQWNDIIPSVTFWSEAKGGISPSDFTAYFNFSTGYVRGFTPGSNPVYSPNLFTPLT